MVQPRGHYDYTVIHDNGCISHSILFVYCIVYLSPGSAVHNICLATKLIFASK